jgi:signal recognition particle receptor subunit beta
MVSINTEGDRTLFFDFLPMGLGKIRGCDVRVQLYTVPGQVKYSSTRKLVLRGVDGIVFVADSLEVRREKIWNRSKTCNPI